MTSSINRKYITYHYTARTCIKKSGGDRKCSSEDVIADRQTHTQTDRPADTLIASDTPLLYRVHCRVITGSTKKLVNTIRDVILTCA